MPQPTVSRGELRPARAVARSNIALAKYWGKADVAENLPAVPSVSLTLAELETETEVSFDRALDRDELTLDDRAATESETRRVVELLDRVRRISKIPYHARVTTKNHFPTAAGLASSASGFAALAAAAMRAAGTTIDSAELSALARRSSASAARSIFGGFVGLDAGRPGDCALAAKPLASATHWDVRLIVAIAASGPKAVGSTQAMEASRITSPFYDAWVEASVGWAITVKQAIEDRDLEALGTAMERSTLAFHACAMTSAPSTIYWRPATLAALETVRQLRADGVPVWSTMDAGPHVKALCEVCGAQRVAQALRSTPGILDVLITRPGPGVEVSS